MSQYYAKLSIQSNICVVLIHGCPRFTRALDHSIDLKGHAIIATILFYQGHHIIGSARILSFYMIVLIHEANMQFSYRNILYKSIL